MRRTLAVVAAALGVAAALTACGASAPYAPTSYGGSGQCYYIDDPREVAALQASGLCPVNWVAYPAPVWYRARYADYFGSPTYYDHYVPVGVRKTYVTHVTTWNGANGGAINAQRVAVSKSSSSYNSGNSRTADRAGGASSSRSSSSSVRVGSSSGRSYSSGSRR